MPRDANGNYSLPSGNPVVTQTDISSVWANDTMSDIGTEMTDSLSRSGKGGMTGPFPIVDKSGNIPGLSFAAEPTSGIKREAAGDMRAQVQGVDKMRWTASQDAEVFRNSTWQKVAVEPASGKYMTGEGGVTTLFHYGTTAAPGWTIEEPDSNIRELVIGPAAGGGVIGGSQNPTSLGATVNISVSVPISGDTDFKLTGARTTGGPSGTTGLLAAGATARAASENHTHQLDFGSGHRHAFSDTGNGSDSDSFTLTPRYARGLLMKLDA